MGNKCIELIPFYLFADPIFFHNSSIKSSWNSIVPFEILILTVRGTFCTRSPPSEDGGWDRDLLFHKVNEMRGLVVDLALNSDCMNIFRFFSWRATIPSVFFLVRGDYFRWRHWPSHVEPSTFRNGKLIKTDLCIILFKLKIPPKLNGNRW